MKKQILKWLEGTTWWKLDMFSSNRLYTRTRWRAQFSNGNGELKFVYHEWESGHPINRRVALAEFKSKILDAVQ